MELVGSVPDFHLAFSRFMGLSQFFEKYRYSIIIYWIFFITLLTNLQTTHKKSENDIYAMLIKNYISKEEENLLMQKSKNEVK